MLIINNIEHKIEKIDVQIGQYEKNSYVDGKKISEKGLSPVFIIKADSNIVLRIETLYLYEIIPLLFCSNLL